MVPLVDIKRRLNNLTATRLQLKRIIKCQDQVLADLMTKALSRPRINELQEKIGLCEDDVERKSKDEVETGKMHSLSNEISKKQTLNSGI
ncbi:hypothetical protein PsorP6_005880 [Peronosclerospora sorghi]|uniref:Uncharacterized protein n=1 Tax=Peronosclerospora sorghi TaxID=230839 RepID=A0ACC0W451_9STRA|nr:hypothetical protein PsorP6_005880 [Peronosclerospora sorghi]